MNFLLKSLKICAHIFFYLWKDNKKRRREKIIKIDIVILADPDLVMKTW